MGHRLFPAASNFPVPGHQVRHSPPGAVKCLSASRPVDMARKITPAETQTVAVWTGVGSQSGRRRQRLLWTGAGLGATRRGDDGLVGC